MKNFTLLVGILLIGAVVQAQECVTDQLGLLKLVGSEEFHAEWIETTQDDGKPLMIKMQSQKDRLYFIFDKTKEGVWAEGLIRVCKNQDKLIVKISKEDIKVGDAAPWLIKMAMGGGAEFKLQITSKDKMHVAITGWSGDFIPQSEVMIKSPEIAVAPIEPAKPEVVKPERVKSKKSVKSKATKKPVKN